MERIVTPDVGGDVPKWATEQHVACVLLLDTSGSMTANDAIGKLNAGVRQFQTQAMTNEQTKACVDVAVVSFGPGVRVWKEFGALSEMSLPALSADGGTPMGAAINKALDMIAERKQVYKDWDTPYYRPWLFCITDGGPNDSWQSAAQRLKQEESEKHVLGYCVGVENFNREIMSQIFDKERLFELTGLDFTGLFKFLSNSLAAVRNSGQRGGGSVDVQAPGSLKMAF